MGIRFHVSDKLQLQTVFLHTLFLSIFLAFLYYLCLFINKKRYVKHLVKYASEI